METLTNLMRCREEPKPSRSESPNLEKSMIADYERENQNLSVLITICAKLEEIEIKIDNLIKKQEELEKRIIQQDERTSNNKIRQFALNGGVTNFMRTKTDSDIPWK